jgi:hypothetical protein
MEPARVQSIGGIDPGTKMIFTGLLEQRRKQRSAAGRASRITADLRNGPTGNAANAPVNGCNPRRDNWHLRTRLLSKSRRTPVTKPMLNLGANDGSRKHISRRGFFSLFIRQKKVYRKCRQNGKEKKGRIGYTLISLMIAREAKAKVNLATNAHEQTPNQEKGEGSSLQCAFGERL